MPVKVTIFALEVMRMGSLNLWLPSHSEQNVSSGISWCQNSLWKCPCCRPLIKFLFRSTRQRFIFHQTLHHPLYTIIIRRVLMNTTIIHTVNMVLRYLNGIRPFCGFHLLEKSLLTLKQMPLSNCFVNTGLFWFITWTGPCNLFTVMYNSHSSKPAVVRYFWLIHFCFFVGGPENVTSTCEWHTRVAHLLYLACVAFRCMLFSPTFSKQFFKFSIGITLL